MNILFFDTETTGLLKYELRSHEESQPRLVQLGAVLHDENRKVRAAVNLIVNPFPNVIPEEAEAVHGISTMDAAMYGVPLVAALGVFNSLVNSADLIVAHNLSYDARIMKGHYVRGGEDSPLEGKQTFCTMLKSTPILKLPSKRGHKWPNLQEAHRFFLGEGFDGAHDAMVDVLACSRVYYKMMERLRSHLKIHS